MEVKIMANRNPIKYTGKALDKRNTLTGPDEGKRPFPVRPKHVSIQQPNNKNI
jgi:hypothetical protein